MIGKKIKKIAILLPGLILMAFWEFFEPIETSGGRNIRVLVCFVLNLFIVLVFILLKEIVMGRDKKK